MEAVKSWKAPTTPSEVRSFLRLAEFSYNNSYHSSIRCAPFEALYGRKCRLPVLWAGIGDSSLIGPELVQEIIDKVVVIRDRLKAARDCQKCYADNRRKPLEFQVGDHVMLKVSPWKGVVDKTVSFVDEPLERNEEDRKKWNRQQRFMDREGQNLKRVKYIL
ncbi:putative reverse transcriptase domain-containing protein [Tanacetum coccineum]|uniref:Reverse transcriptase domain-containing protein n=1 Tax=Tanacetum coccineum TaxID=301880 RepID=A0ABQ4YRU5_9ASTR